MPAKDRPPPSADPPEEVRADRNGANDRSTRSRRTPQTAQPILLVKIIAGRQLIARCCPASADAGVKIDMTLSHARALVKTESICVRPYDPQRDSTALTALANWALRFSPVVMPDPPDGLLLDITGCQRLFHGERRLVNTLANSLEWLGFHARAASASTFACAWAAARFGDRERIVIPTGAEREALSPLPVDGLNIDEETAIALREVGIECIGHIIDLPRLELVTRFGGDLLLRLDQATGEAAETIEPLRPRIPIWAERTFDGPVRQLEAILITVRELIAELAAQLQERESGARRIVLNLARSDAPPLRQTIVLSRPSRNVKHLWALLRPRVENANLGFGVDCVTLEAKAIAPLRHEQDEQWRAANNANGHGSRRDSERRLGEFIDTLTDRFGPDRAVRVELVESHIPERSFRYHPAAHGEVLSAACGQLTASPRPSILLAEPESVRIVAQSPEGVLSAFDWRGAALKVMASLGPERIEPEWWRERMMQADDEVREMCKSSRGKDYYRIQDDRGRWLWMYRHLLTGRWFVHGQWA
ncbi:MAG: DNA polymerase Y family protein [Phycisphaerales bacterium]|nr:MAG: DNA polymerase Y family protein [Phycisphaerales bacterium]